MMNAFMIKRGNEMSMQRKVYDCVAGCPVESTLQIISGKWKSVILYRLFQEQVARYSDFERWLPTISSRMLARQLQELVTDDVVTKQIYAQIPPKTEYRLTEFGQTLRPVIEAMEHWGQYYNHLQMGQVTLPDAQENKV
ncbi:transcriptional regulator, HxlR family [Levilactobacillus brevis ATCC 14869 = DSM 20054]|uniref:Transcriptional regulator, HxlR family n=2 Tax=Levilactobacillus brevis TaxID=1580 RepID=U2PFT1_LEVBR|nr:transcriptional regulator, HxlR family [Levilactobacillus brevis ATCC 14869 = DSM 20054]